jgi:hypothetical protein
LDGLKASRRPGIRGSRRETVKTVGRRFLHSVTLLKQGVNEMGLIFMFMVLHFFTQAESHNELVSDKGKVWGHLVPEVLAGRAKMGKRNRGKRKEQRNYRYET